METWIDICQRADIVPGTGVCALLGEAQVAVFRCRQTDALYAIDNYDPIGRAFVLSRGIIGCIEGVTVVASPLYKQHFNLTTGACLQSPEFKLKTYGVRYLGDRVQLFSTAI